MNKNLENLIEKLVKNGALKTEAIIESFKKIDRADFIDPQYKSLAYADNPLPIGPMQTISQPSTVAFTIETLGPKIGDKILDVGSGSGWTTALLASIVGAAGSIYGVEVVPQLVEFGQNNISKYNFKNAKIIEAKQIGLPEESPFDKILVSASASEIPKELIEQLKNGGTMVIPIKNSIIKLTKNHKGEIITTEYLGFEFVPFVNI